MDVMETKIEMTYSLNQMQRDATKNLSDKEKQDSRELNAQKNIDDNADPDDYESGYIL